MAGDVPPSRPNLILGRDLPIRHRKCPRTRSVGQVPVLHSLTGFVRAPLQLSDALLREPSLAGLPLTPTVHVPMWRGTPATIELMGRVPTPELKDTVLRIVRDEAARIRSDVQIEDRLSVVPTMARVA